MPPPSAIFSVSVAERAIDRARREVGSCSLNIAQRPLRGFFLNCFAAYEDTGSVKDRSAWRSGNRYEGGDRRRSSGDQLGPDLLFDSPFLLGRNDVGAATTCPVRRNPGISRAGRILLDFRILTLPSGTAGPDSEVGRRFSSRGRKFTEASILAKRQLRHNDRRWLGFGLSQLA